MEASQLRNIVLVSLFTILILTSFYVTALTTERIIGNFGRIKTVNVGVYEESECLNVLTVIDWGVLEPSETKNKSCYLRNEANVPVVLNLTTQNWLPVNASNYIFLVWDYAEEILEVNEVIGVVFSLSVSPDIEGIENFSFDILVMGEG